jgi:hypothetical protein
MRPLIDVRVPLFQPHRNDLGAVIFCGSSNEGPVAVEPESSFEPPQELSRLPHVCACVLRLRHNYVWMRAEWTRRVVLLIAVLV